MRQVGDASLGLGHAVRHPAAGDVPRGNENKTHCIPSIVPIYTGAFAAPVHLVLASTHRLAETDRFDKNDGGWWEVSETRTYLGNGDGTPTRLSRTRRRLGTAPARSWRPSRATDIRLPLSGLSPPNLEVQRCGSDCDGTPGMARSYRRDGSLETQTDAAGTTAFAYSGSNPLGESVAGGLLDGQTLSYPEGQGLRQSFTAASRDDKMRPMKELHRGLARARRSRRVSGVPHGGLKGGNHPARFGTISNLPSSQRMLRGSSGRTEGIERSN